LKQLYAFRAHFNTKKDGQAFRPPKANQDRDGWATHLLVEALRPQFDLVVPGFNTDASDIDERSVRRRLHSGDLVLTSTRLGMNDLDDQVRTPVPLANNWLERQLLDGWRQYIGHCSRKRIELTAEGAQAMEPTGRHLANLKFTDTDDASYSYRRGKEKSTAGYVIRSSAIPRTIRRRSGHSSYILTGAGAASDP